MKKLKIYYYNKIFYIIKKYSFLYLCFNYSFKFILFKFIIFKKKIFIYFPFFIKKNVKLYEYKKK
ncbi:hypothetical protein CRP_123 [Candidatus Carsonella ruddii PV]|uniref:Uncharacterized protein n=1 Tax=Carsonella ruddii (strain PV) TaxID=387662 RepID=Q05FL7_CARRP|nr:hypothetical protein [Candidatus Carsonella ruddii]BAF35154.1 hypothetical protein CRP_123 [Candidatus Carsonella ruddii PV]